MTHTHLRRWYLVHKWTSLVCTLFLLMLCVTGLPLIFHDEIDAALGAPRAPAHVPAQARLDLDAVVAEVRQAHPQNRVTYLGFELDEPLLRVFTAPDFTPDEEHTTRDAFDARTGERLSGNASYAKLSGFLLELHESMFLGLPAELFLGLMGVLLVAALVSGVVVYVPFMRKLKFATLRRTRSARLRWLDLHNLMGMVTVGWLGVVGITGVINTLSTPAAALWQGTELVAMLQPYRSLPPPARIASLNLILDEALRSSPGMKVSSVAFPGSPFSSARHFTVFLRGDTPLTSRLIAPRLVDAQTGQVVAARDMPVYVKTLFLSKPLHFGDYGGLPLKILWALLDLVTIVVLGSGVYLWLGRRRTPVDRRIEELLAAGAAP